MLRVCVVILQGYHWTFGPYIAFLITTEFISMSANTLNFLPKRKNLDSLKHNSVRILVNCFNQVFAYLYSFTLGCCSAMYVSLMNGMIKSYGKIPLGVYSAFPFAIMMLTLCWAVRLNTASKVHTKSGEYIRMQKKMECDRKLAVRVLRSLKRIGIVFGSLGTVTRFSSLQLFDAWMDQTADVLLASG